MDSTFLHEMLKEELLAEFRLRGYDVIAVSNSTQYAAPKTIGGCLPDIIANNANEDLCLGEAKTAEDIRTDASMKEYVAFAQEAKELHLIIPGSERDILEQVLHLLNLGVQDGCQIVIWGSSMFSFD
jgi:hypothetical protein